MKRVTLVIGGARSGKSAHAESLAALRRGNKLYVATAEAFDDEMIARIAQHRARRGGDWDTIEAPIDLVPALEANDGKDRIILVDCLTVWLGNLMHREREVEPAVAQLCEALANAKGTLILVSNEVGSGIVPENALAREFRDIAGRVNQAVASIADEVILVVAGQALTIKKPGRARSKRR